MKKLLALLLAFILLFSLAACSENEKPEGTLSFTAYDIYGEEITSDIFENSEITVVNVWGTFCSPCIYEMPFLGELSREYDKKDVQFVGIVSDVVDYFGKEDPDAVALAKELVAETKAEYTHIVPSSEVIAFLYDVTAVPTTFFLDSEGRVIGEPVVGAREKEAWKEIIDARLGEVR